MYVHVYKVDRWVTFGPELDDNTVSVRSSWCEVRQQNVHDVVNEIVCLL